jgi:hypothetical protein
MCSKEYLVKRKRAILRVIEQTITLAIDGAEDDNGGCFAGKLEEMKYVIFTLHAQADHLGVVIRRIDRISDEEGEAKAVLMIGNLIAKKVGEYPPDELFEFFDVRMN